MNMSIKELSELTEIHRDSVSRRLVDLPFQTGPRGAHLYESREALPLIFAVDSLEAARAKQALSQASLNAVRTEEFRKRLIPREEVTDVFEQVRNVIMTVLRRSKIQKATVNRIADKFRAAGEKLKRT